MKMSDLISRSELLKRFCINKDGHRMPERDCDNFEVTVSIKVVKTIIKISQQYLTSIRLLQN